MCGIVGVIYNGGTRSPLTAFKELLFLDTLRGEHSTGIALAGKWRGVVKDSDQVISYKKAVSGPDFLQLNKTNKVLAEAIDYHFWLGHNRYATVGRVVDSNAHPFVTDRFVLVHNGTVQNEGHLKSKFIKDPKYSIANQVDSRTLTRAIHDHGNLAEVLGQTQGSYSLVVYDRTTNSLLFARDNQRPMHMAVFEDSETILFGSDPSFLECIAERNHMPLKNVFSLKPFVVHECTFVNGKMNWTNRGEWKEYKYTYEAPATSVGFRGGHGHNSHGTAHNNSYQTDFNREEKEWFKEIGIAKGDKLEFEFDEVAPFDTHRPYTAEPNKNSFGFLKGWFLVGDDQDATHGVELVNVRVFGMPMFNFPKLPKVEANGKINIYCQGPIHRMTTGPSASLNRDERAVVVDHEGLSIIVEYKEGPILREVYYLKFGAWAMRSEPRPDPDEIAEKVLVLPGPKSTTEQVVEDGATLSDAIQSVLGTDKPLTSEVVSVVPFLVRGPRGDLINVNEWRKAVQDGCQGGCNQSFTDPHELIYWHNDQPVCKECQERLTNAVHH